MHVWRNPEGFGEIRAVQKRRVLALAFLLRVAHSHFSPARHVKFEFLLQHTAISALAAAISDDGDNTAAVGSTLIAQRRSTRTRRPTAKAAALAANSSSSDGEESSDAMQSRLVALASSYSRANKRSRDFVSRMPAPRVRTRKPAERGARENSDDEFFDDETERAMVRAVASLCEVNLAQLIVAWHVAVVSQEIPGSI